MPWFTEISKRKIYDQTGRTIGRVQDLSATRGRYPQVTGLKVRLDRAGRHLIGTDRGATFFPWRSVSEIEGRLTLMERSPASEKSSDDLYLNLDVMDRQIVDTDGARVVRVNDLLLHHSAGSFRVVAADVGFRGALRQLGIEKPVMATVNALGYTIEDKLIAWNYVARLEEGGGEVRLTVPSSVLRELHPSELADILDQMDGEQRERILGVMSNLQLAETLAEAEPEVSIEALALLGEERVRRVLELMPPDEATDLLGVIGYEGSERLLGLMGVREASVLRELLGYPPDTAGGRMTPSFAGVPSHATATEAIEMIRKMAPRAETIYFAYVLDESGRLEGVLSLRQLLRSSPDRKVADLMEKDVVHVDVAADQEEVARIMSRYNLLAVPVTESGEFLRGIVTVDDIVDVLEEEASEDLAEVSGVYLGEGALLDTGRLAGFGMSLVAGMLGALLLRSERGVLLSIAALAWLLPIYLRMAQDLGTWSLARALAASNRPAHRQLDDLMHELLAALASSAFSGLLVGIFGAWWTRSAAAAFVLGVGLFVGTLAASLIGLGLPTLVKSLGLRRALVHGRLLAIVVGVCSLLVYVWALGSLAGHL